MLLTSIESKTGLCLGWIGFYIVIPPCSTITNTKKKKIPLRSCLLNLKWDFNLIKILTFTIYPPNLLHRLPMHPLFC